MASRVTKVTPSNFADSLPDMLQQVYPTSDQKGGKPVLLDQYGETIEALLSDAPTEMPEAVKPKIKIHPHTATRICCRILPWHQIFI